MKSLENKVNIAIDGLPASGKDTITKIMHYVLNQIYDVEWKVVDSSMIYRALSFYLEDNQDILGVRPLSELHKTNTNCGVEIDKIIQIVSCTHVDTDFQNNESIVFYQPDSTFSRLFITYDYGTLKTPTVDNIVGFFATIAGVRPFIVAMEIDIAKDGFCLVPGRDGYTVVLGGDDMPHSIGLYPFANLEVRAQRRLKERGQDNTSEYSKIVKAMEIRDMQDSSRTGSGVPLSMKTAEALGYLCIDTSGLSIYQTGIKAVSKVLEKIPDMDIPQTQIESLVYSALIKHSYEVPENAVSVD